MATPERAENDDFLTIARSRAYLADPYPFLERIRETAPVYHSPSGIWLLTRYADVYAALRDRTLSSDVTATGSEAPQPGSAAGRRGPPPNLLMLDPPDHTRIRRLVSQAFTPKAVERLRPRVTTLVRETLEHLAARGANTVHLIGDYAYPLPVTVICDLLGIPPADNRRFRGWSRRLGASIDPDFVLTDRQRWEAARAGREFAIYFLDLIERRRRDLGGDVLSAMIAVEADGDRLTQEELIVNGIFLVVSGHESTVNLIGNGVLALLQHPAELGLLRNGDVNPANSIEELLRFDSPLQLSVRTTCAAYRVGDTLIPAGQRLMPLLGAANRDPRMFEDPDRLDLERDNARRNVAFGGGMHICLGAPLARMVGEIAITSLIRRFPNLAQAGPPRRERTFTLRGLGELPVALYG